MCAPCVLLNYRKVKHTRFGIGFGVRIVILIRLQPAPEKPTGNIFPG